MRCIHPSQRCISSKQIPVNIFEQESVILLTDFVAAYPSVDHSWILTATEKTELHVFLSAASFKVFTTTAPRMWNSREATRGQFLMARGVRQGCPASGFIFAMAFDPFFRWVQETVFPGGLDNLDFLQPAQCAYADDFAVAASSFRGLMAVLAPAFHSVYHIAGLNLNYRKCCWVQNDTEGRESLCHWISENCGEFRASALGP